MSSPALRFSLVVFVACAALPTLHAATTAPTADQLKSWAGIRRQRVDLLRDEIKQADARIESRLDIIISTLTSISDTKQSGTKVARMKEETMKRLLATIQLYDQKRAVVREELRHPQSAASAEEKRKIVAVFDAHIQKRVDQIIALHKSMPAFEDHDRYRSTGSGWNGTNYERNLDFEQNQRMTTHSNQQRDALVKQLDASIARLERLSQAMRSQVAASTDQAQQSERGIELAENDALIAQRRREKLELFQGSDMAQRSVPLKEAMDLDKSLQKAAVELRRDINMLFQRYNTFVSELNTLHGTEAALAAAQRTR